MDMEMLKELRKRLEYNSELEDEEIENLWELIDEAIARQSATSLIPHNINYYKCEKCEQLIHKYIHKPKYCPYCGRAIKED